MLSLYFFEFIIALLGSIVTIKAIIIVAKQKHLYDEPIEERKIHISRISNLGGVGMYCTFIFSLTLILPNNQLSYLNSFIASSMILFAIGLKDDLIGVSPNKKFVAQIFAALILSYIGDVRFTNLYGLFSVTEISYPLSILLTILFSIFIYNAINLSDGIDGLAGLLGIVATVTYGVFFWLLDSKGDLFLVVGFLAILIGFLYYNLSPAKIFMGDTGSLFTGFMLSLFTVRFLEINSNSKTPLFESSPSIALSVLIIPVFDTLRVFFLRIIRGQSPFAADKNHLHHRLLNLGFSHIQSSLIISGTTLIFIFTAVFFQPIGNIQLFIFLILLAILLNFFLWNLSRKKQVESANVVNIKESLNENKKLPLVDKANN